MTARLHLLVAKEAPVVVIIRRKPSKMFHIIKWNLDSDTFEYGSWFKGKIYSKRCDLSWDGQHMVYLAMGAGGDTWNGVCRVPWLKTVVEWDNDGAWDGGGVFWKQDLLLRNLGNDPKSLFAKLTQLIPFAPESPIRFEEGWNNDFEIDYLRCPGHGEDLPILFYRLYRDGFRPKGYSEKFPVFGDDSKLKTLFNHHCEWRWRFSESSPVLTTRYIGYNGAYKKQVAAEYRDRTGYLFHFELEGFPGLLGPQVEWASWTSVGDLVWTRDGCVFRLSQEGLARGEEPKVFDFEDLERPTHEEQILG